MRGGLLRVHLHIVIGGGDVGWTSNFDVLTFSHQTTRRGGNTVTGIMQGSLSLMSFVHVCFVCHFD